MGAAWAYRVRQFRRAVGAWLLPARVDDDWAARWLSPPAMALFRAMPRYDRRHAANVARKLAAGGHAEPELIAAALLHDAGKTAGGDGRLWLAHRVAFVLLQAARPGLLERLGRDGPARGWRAPCYVQVHHAAIGARLAIQAGCPPRVAELIAWHEDRDAAARDVRLGALMAADEEY